MIRSRNSQRTRGADTHSLPGAERHTRLDAAIVEALEAPPVVAVPFDFAARVAQQASRQVATSRRISPGWGPRVALACMPLLALLLFLLAPYAHASLENAAFEAELLLVCELGALAVWLPWLVFRPDR